MSRPSDEPGRAAYYRLCAHVRRVQDEACDLDALIEGLVILKDHDKGANAFEAVLTIAQAKAFAIFNALDSANLPKLDPPPA
ncbi:hypothetical protein [Tabrizicola soli]|uniref:Uncharacterized protein n=1 Tax=Tabrizicola soli TaxID=2185115 RepID=A0ABV7E0W4_9RHOB|nr:hypothetical protein [Tabrizicola soli]